MTAALSGKAIGADIAPHATLGRRYERLCGERSARLRDRDACNRRLAEVRNHLELAPAVERALDQLSDRLFGGVAQAIERHLTAALQEVLQQPLVLRVNRQFKRGSAGMSFHVERAGHEEDIMRGQGGSVANILSVGLRLLAMTTLDKAKHRRFLVLDEQDCWLAPALVSRFVKIVRDAAKSLGFQILMISHHDDRLIGHSADSVRTFVLGDGGVRIGISSAGEPDVAVGPADVKD